MCKELTMPYNHKVWRAYVNFVYVLIVIQKYSIIENMKSNTLDKPG